MKISPRLDRESGRDYACRMIRENIVSLDLAPGSLVSEKELAQELDLSRTPVREALIDLSKVGIVEVLPQRGSRIAYIDYQMVDEAQFMRSALEVAICNKLSAIANPEMLAPLLENLPRQEEAISRDDWPLFHRLDDQFHKSLYDLAGVPHAHQLVSSYTVHFDRVRNLSLYVTQVGHLLQEHRELIFGLLAHDRPMVAETISRHLNRYQQDKAAIRQEYPAYFGPKSK